MGDQIELLEFSIRKYKNLEDTRVEWSDRVAIYGPNGAGKTNLLEALALAFGSRASLWQLSPRAAEVSGAGINAVIAGTPHELPLPPDLCNLRGDPAEKADPFTDAYRFWRTAAVDRGESWAAACAEFPDSRLGELLAAVERRTLVRYRLESLSGMDAARVTDRGQAIREGYDEADQVAFERSFSRTLVVEEPLPQWLANLAPSLPEAFAPLRRWLDEPPSSRGRFADLLELPIRDWAPIRVVWLASERESSEALYDLWDAYERAAPAADALGQVLDELILRRSSLAADEVVPEHVDARFWLAVHVARPADRLLDLVAPDLELIPDGERPGEILVMGRADAVRPRRPHRHLADDDFFEVLSSGQRSWVDVGLAQGIAQLESLEGETSWIPGAWEGMYGDDRLAAGVQLFDQISGEAQEDNSWPVGDIELALTYLRTLFGDIYHSFRGASEISSEEQRFLNALTSHYSPELRPAFEPTLVIHAYDEPERHLHPAAQRRVASYLNEPRAEAIALATHSHLFLGAPGWLHLHVSPTPEGAVLSGFEPSEIGPHTAIARQLGLTRGELLALVRYVLFVEGPVDAIVLGAFYGELLAEAGIAVVPFHGVDEVASLAQLELLDRVLDVGMGVLVDHANVKRLQKPLSPAFSKEEQALTELRRSLKRRGRKLEFFGLKAEDILVYVDDDTIRSLYPQFPGWPECRRRRAKGQSVKATAERTIGERMGTRFATQATNKMREAGRVPGGDLPAVVAAVVAAADSRTL